MSFIQLTDTNVVILYGQKAVDQFSEMADKWANMLPPNGWDDIRFILTSDAIPDNLSEMKDETRQHVTNNNAKFYSISEAAPDAQTLISWLRNSTDVVRLHPSSLTREIFRNPALKRHANIMLRALMCSRLASVPSGRP